MSTKEIDIQLDFRSPVPIYIQIVEGIREMVARGDLHQGDQLPTVRQLAEQLRINFNTVARAYRCLDDARLISTQRGRGTFIWEEPTAETIQALRKESLDAITHQYLEEADRLGFERNEIEQAVRQQLDQRQQQPNDGQSQEESYG